MVDDLHGPQHPEALPSHGMSDPTADTHLATQRPASSPKCWIASFATLPPRRGHSGHSRHPLLGRTPSSGRRKRADTMPTIMGRWALDLGHDQHRARALGRGERPAAARGAARDLPQARAATTGSKRPRLVPSVGGGPAADLARRPVGTWRPLERLVLLGRTALIGRPALERNQGIADPAFVPGFKAALSYEPLRPLARRGPAGRHRPWRRARPSCASCWPR